MFDVVLAEFYCPFNQSSRLIWAMKKCSQLSMTTARADVLRQSNLSQCRRGTYLYKTSFWSPRSSRIKTPYMAALDTATYTYRGSLFMGITRIGRVAKYSISSVNAASHLSFHSAFLFSLSRQSKAGIFRSSGIWIDLVLWSFRSTFVSLACSVFLVMELVGVCFNSSLHDQLSKEFSQRNAKQTLSRV